MHERRRQRTFHVEFLESRALLSTVFKGTFHGSIDIGVETHFSTTGTVESSNTKTIQGRAFAGVECQFSGDATVTRGNHRNFIFTKGQVTLLNPERNISLSAFVEGSASGEEFKLVGRKQLVGSNHEEFVGTSPFRLYPEGTFSATGTYDSDTADVTITFKFALTKV
jgi:hypothetical protein